jgi:hypothetical protein
VKLGTCWRQHFGAIGTADGARMHEKTEYLLYTAIISNGIVEEKSIVVARWFSLHRLLIAMAICLKSRDIDII